MSEKVCGVYFIKNTVNEKFYVGSSVDINRRLKGHLSSLRNGRHVNHLLQADWDKFGEANFSTGVLDVTCVGEMIALEQAWIDRIADYNLAPAAGSTLGFKQSDQFKRNQSIRVRGEGNPMFGTKRPDVGERMRALHQGSRLSEEHKRKVSESLKGKGVGREVPQYVRDKISAANKGKVRSEEQRAKMSELVKLRPPPSDETRQKLRESARGRKHSDETKAKLSKAKLGKKLRLSDAERAARSERARNRVVSEEQRAAISARQKGVRRPPDVVKKMSDAMMGSTRSHASKVKQSATMRGSGNHRFGTKMSDETKQKIAETKRRVAEERRRVALI